MAKQQASGRGMTRADIFEFFRRLAELNPDPETELEYGNTYQLLVAVVLSAQATDVGVNKATRRLFEAVKTPQAMLDLGEAGLKDHIKTIGLFNAKAASPEASCGTARPFAPTSSTGRRSLRSTASPIARSGSRRPSRPSPIGPTAG